MTELPLLGFGVPVSGSWATPDRIVQIATTAEGLGYHSLWTFQRLLAAVDDAGAHTLRPMYRSVIDPVATLSYLAAITERVRLGVAVLNVPFASPALLAKQLTTVDVLSGGRVDVGLGTGWQPEEFEASGIPQAGRGARMDEYLDALAAIWDTDGVVEHHGPLYDIPRSRFEPAPIQRPHPPILLGGAVPAALRRAGRAADGWISSSLTDLTTIGDQIAIVREAAVEAGRDPERLRFVTRGVVLVRDERNGPLTGSFDEIRGDLADLKRHGVDEVFLDLNFDPEVGSPDADPDDSMRRARELLAALAP